MRALNLILLTLICAVGAAAESLVVVVHPSRPGSLSIEEISRIYLKQQLFWGSGDGIIPINREARSPTRRRFDRVVFGSRSGKLSDYWNRQYFRGVLPPATLASDEAVRRFVASEPRAIGYLPERLVDSSVRVAARLDVGEAASRHGQGGEGSASVGAPRSALRVGEWEFPQRASDANRDAETARLVHQGSAPAPHRALPRYRRIRLSTRSTGS